MRLALRYSSRFCTGLVDTAFALLASAFIGVLWLIGGTVVVVGTAFVVTVGIALALAAMGHR